MDYEKITQREKKCKSCGFVTFCVRVLYRHKYKCQGQLLGKPLSCGYCKRKYFFHFLLEKHKKACVRRNKKLKALSKYKLKTKQTVNGKFENKKKGKNKRKESKPTTIVCPLCMKFFTSRSLYAAHEKKGTCQLNKTIKKKSFSARKSFPVTSKYKKRNKYLDRISDSESDSSFLSEIVERNRRMRNSFSDRYKCIRCKNKYLAKVILLKHLELNYKCAMAHYEFDFYQGKSHKARKSIQPIVARKSFSYTKCKRFSSQSTKISPVFQRSARKSLKTLSPNIKASSSIRSLPTISKQVVRSLPNKLSSAKPANQCPVCYEVFPDSFNFYQHQKKVNHWGKATKSMNLSCKCPFCQKEFYSVRARNAHIQNHADKSDQNIESFLKSTICDICSQVFVSETIKLQHMKVEHSSKYAINNSLTIDNLEKNSKYLSLPTVIKQKLKQYPFTCPICAKEFVSTSLRNKHFEDNHLNSEVDCIFCPIKCSTEEQLDNHMKKFHYNQFKHECFVCKVKLPSMSHVKLHVKKLHSNNNFKRNVPVTEPFSQQNSKIITSTEKAAVKELQEKSQSYFCDICNLSFQKQQFLKRHEQSKQHCDTLVKNLDAVHESLSNLPPSSLQAHPKQIQIPDNLFCSECFEEFSQLKDFVPHRLSHFSEKGKYMEINEENTYKCEICGDVSDSNSKVQMHLFWHLQVESSLKDKNSDDSDKTNPVLTNKSGQHVAKKSFGKQRRDTHQEVVIGGVKKQLFMCEACNIGFTNQAHYNMHVRKFCKMKTSGGPNQISALNNCDKIELTDINSALNFNTETNNSEASNTNYLEIEIEQCNLCYCIFNKTVKLIHNELCSLCKQTNFDITCNVDDFKSSIKLEKAIAACLRCKCLFTLSQNFVDHMISSHNHLETTTSGKHPDYSEGNKEAIVSDVKEDIVDKVNEDVAKENTTNEAKEDICNKIEEVPVVEGDLVLHCLTCNMIFFNTDVLKDHEMSCINFSYTNSRLENYTPEFKAALEMNSIISSCLTCDLAFNTTQDLTEHVALHQANAVTQADIEKSKITSGDDETFLNDGTTAVNENNLIQDSTLIRPLTSDSQSQNITNTLPNTYNAPVMDHTDSSISLSENSTSTLQNKQKLSEIDILRKNFSQLLSILVADPDLMQQLGYGELTVDEVLINVLQVMEQTPILKDENISDIDCLRKNIQLLLDFCLEDQIMALIGDGKASTDDIVIEALKIFGGESSMSIVALE